MVDLVKLLHRLLLCPLRGHIPESQFASGVCGDCGKLFWGTRRYVRPMQ